MRVFSSSPSAREAPDACWLLPIPTATEHAPRRQLGGRRPSGTKREVDLPTVIAMKICPPLPGAGAGRIRLLPTPDTGTTPNGHGCRGGRFGNGHESGHSLDVIARTFAQAAGHVWSAPGAAGAPLAVRWGDYGRRSAAGNRPWGGPRPRPPSPALARVPC